MTRPAESCMRWCVWETTLLERCGAYTAAQQPERHGHAKVAVSDRFDPHGIATRLGEPVLDDWDWRTTGIADPAADA